MNGQFKRKFSNEELDMMHEACQYYYSFATNEVNGLAGLPIDSKERRIMKRVLDKIREVD